MKVFKSFLLIVFVTIFTVSSAFAEEEKEDNETPPSVLSGVKIICDSEREDLLNSAEARSALAQKLEELKLKDAYRNINVISIGGFSSSRESPYSLSEERVTVYFESESEGKRKILVLNAGGAKIRPEDETKKAKLEVLKKARLEALKEALANID